MVERIKSVPNETTLLVIDAVGLAFYIERNITITSTQFNVQVLTTPPQAEAVEQVEEVVEEEVVHEQEEVVKKEEVVHEQEEVVKQEEAVEPVEEMKREEEMAEKQTTPEKQTTDEEVLTEEEMVEIDIEPEDVSVKDVQLKWPAVRLCHIVKWKKDIGFGFHLKAEKKRSGHFIGKVDAGSPAEAAQLRLGDRIIEVNGVNIANENHKQVIFKKILLASFSSQLNVLMDNFWIQVVERIKAVANETKLLAVDPETEAFYVQRNVAINGTMKSVEEFTNPPPEPSPEPSPVELRHPAPPAQVNQSQQIAFDFRLPTCVEWRRHFDSLFLLMLNYS